MIKKNTPEDYTKISEGIFIKTLVHGEKTLMSEFILLKGHELPTHSHPHEQTGYLVSGKIILHIEEESQELTAGDSWNIAGNASHSAEVLEDSVAIEIFSPVREDYLRYS